MKHMVVKTGDNTTDEVEVYQAQVATSATTATTATNATNATNAANATNASNVTTTINGQYITTIFQPNGITVKEATHSVLADSATSATKATQDGDGNIISSTYAKQSGTYPDMTVGNANSACALSRTTIPIVANDLSKIGWWKIGEITAAKLLTLSQYGGDYSAIFLLNGGAPTGATSPVAVSGMIELDGRVESGNFVLNNNQIKILCGNISTDDVGAIWTADKIELYFYMRTSYSKQTFTVLSEFLADRMIQGFSFDASFVSQAEPSGLSLGVNVNRARYDSSGNEIAIKFDMIDLDIANIWNGNSTVGHAENATKATQDADGNDIVDTYAKKAELSNPNLLINPDFRINQRGASSYSGTVAKYSADRWYLNSGSLYIEDEGIRMVAVAGVSCTLSQYIEDDLELGTRYTVSIKCGSSQSAMSTYHGSFEIQSKPTSTTTFLTLSLGTNASLVVNYNSSKGYYSVYIQVNMGNTLYVDWVKLEKGSVATMFVPPNITTELLKCQRYYTQYAGNGVFCADGFASNTSTAIMSVWLPATMRTTPTISGSGLYLSSGNHLASSSKACSLTGSNISFENNCVKFEVSSSGLTDAEACKIQIRTSSGYLEFDAEL